MNDFSRVKRSEKNNSNVIYHHPFRAKLHKPKVTHNTLAQTAAFHALYQIHNMPKKHGRPHHGCVAYTVNHGRIVCKQMTKWMGKRVRLSLANFFLIFIPHVLFARLLMVCHGLASRWFVVRRLCTRILQYSYCSNTLTYIWFSGNKSANQLST